MVDLNRLNVQAMRLKFRKAASCALGGCAASLSPPPAQRVTPEPALVLRRDEEFRKEQDESLWDIFVNGDEEQL